MNEEISLTELFNIIFKKKWTILISSLGGFVLALGITILFISPSYQSQAQLLVNQTQSANETLQYNDVQTNIQLINTYKDILIGQELLNQVNEDLGADISYEVLKNAISIEQSPNSQSFYVRVRAGDPKSAQSILESLLKHFDTTLKEVYGEEEATIYVLSSPSYEENKVAPSVTRNGALGLILGFFVSSFLVVLLGLQDTRVKDTEFLEELGLIQLGAITEIGPSELKQLRQQQAQEINQPGQGGQ